MTGVTAIALDRTRLAHAVRVLLAGIVLLAAATAWGRSADSGHAEARRYIVELRDPPLAAYDGGDLSVDGPRGPLRLAPTAPEITGERRLDADSPASLAYLAYLAERQAEVIAGLEAALGRTLDVRNRYGHATNGFSVHLYGDEADTLRAFPQVRSVEPDRLYRLQTYAGPPWIGATEIWSGATGYPEARGEGVVVAVIDTGINWDHPSFDDAPSDGHVFQNPFGAGLGLCSDPEVLCNDKLVGVYDFVEDRVETPDFEEENTKGKDNDGHGSHTASIAAGRAINATVDGSTRTISGVAPLAHLVSYRACYQGVSDPPSDENAGCWGDFLLAAINRAVADGVDVINYSIGSSAGDPWRQGSIDRAFLNARGAGVFIATSAGNDGPNPGTVGSPALAPWLVAVGNASHNQITGTVLDSFSGGGLPAPQPMTGASLVGGSGKLPIVHARDFGYPLCGTGTPELGRTCAENTGRTNPWAGERPFEGYIVVCDRGDYGRIEKGKNVLLAGAAGYVLANSESSLQSINEDQHCLPATHLGQADGDVLREWLAAGAGHGARITDVATVESDAAADQLAYSSSRGPAGEALAKLDNLMKPNLIAPGIAILGAYSDLSVRRLTGTSMASPHVAGAAALLKSVHPDWGVNELVTALETTATRALAKNDTGDPASVAQVGAGRPQLGQAVNAGFFLDVSRFDFLGADPNPLVGGDLRTLNLPSLVDAECKSSCSFTRTLTDLMGGGEWTAEGVDFPAGTAVTVTPAQFSLAPGGSREVQVNVDLGGTGILGDWVSGRIRFRADGAAEQYLTVSVKSFGGELPEILDIIDDRDSGSETFVLDELVGLPNATFTVGGLVRRDEVTRSLSQDQTDGDPYDGGPGVFTQWYDLPAGALWLYAETPGSSSPDVDLFVGRDDNGNGLADESEELCASDSPDNLERCDLTDVAPGDYWILVQNWEASSPTASDAITLYSAAVESGAGSGLAASGPGIVGVDEAFPLQLSWDGLGALPGETWLGAVGVGSTRSTPNDIGVVPVRFQRLGIASASTFPLMNGRTHGLALRPGSVHDRAFIDVPPGTTDLTVRAEGASAAQSDSLVIDLVRLDFAEALAEVPHAVGADGRPVVVSASGGGGAGPVATVSGGVEPGRWYAVLRNGGSESVSVTVQAELQSDGTQLEVHPGLWYPAAPRDGIGQGYELNWGDGDNPPYSLIWYTYDESGQPAWYIAGAVRDAGNLWTAELLRVTNDGATQQLAPVGRVAVAMLARDDAVFTFTLHGASGSERMQILSPLTCPDGASYTGLWFRGQDGLGGASVLVNSLSQAQIHYLFDAAGMPRWLIASDAAGVAPDAPTIPLLQFNGFCAACAESAVSSQEVGLLERSFSGENAGSWTLDYAFRPPLAGTVTRTDSIIKLTHRLACD